MLISVVYQQERRDRLRVLTRASMTQVFPGLSAIGEIDSPRSSAEFKKERLVAEGREDGTLFEQ